MTIYHGESWVFGPGTRKMAPEDREDAITDVALENLVRERGKFFTPCPGCLWVIHHTEETVHARECEPLRAMAAEVVDG